jgi:hypothetical protein
VISFLDDVWQDIIIGGKYGGISSTSYTYYGRSYTTFQAIKDLDRDSGREKVECKPKKVKKKKENKVKEEITPKKKSIPYKQEIVEKPKVEAVQVLMDLLDFDNEPEYVTNTKTGLPVNLLEVYNTPKQRFNYPQVTVLQEPENIQPIEVNKKPTLLDDAKEIIDMNNLMEVAPKDTKTFNTKLYDDFDDE